jgi:hypothetical protein
MKWVATKIGLAGAILGLFSLGIGECRAATFTNYNTPWTVYYLPSINGYYYQSGPTPRGLFLYSDAVALYGASYGLPPGQRFVSTRNATFSQPYAYPGMYYSAAYGYAPYGYTYTQPYAYPGTTYAPTYGYGNYSYPGAMYAPVYSNYSAPGTYYGR